MPFRCCQCARYLRAVVATTKGDAISEVRGVCATHGEVECHPDDDIWWEDFFGDEE